MEIERGFVKVWVERGRQRERERNKMDRERIYSSEVIDRERERDK